MNICKKFAIEIISLTVKRNFPEAYCKKSINRAFVGKKFITVLDMKEIIKQQIRDFRKSEIPGCY